MTSAALPLLLALPACPGAPARTPGSLTPPTPSVLGSGLSAAELYSKYAEKVRRPVGKPENRPGMGPPGNRVGKAAAPFRVLWLMLRVLRRMRSAAVSDRSAAVSSRSTQLRGRARDTACHVFGFGFPMLRSVRSVYLT